MNETNILAEFSFESKYLTVNGNKIHYMEEGQGDLVLFIENNPGR